MHFDWGYHIIIDAWRMLISASVSLLFSAFHCLHLTYPGHPARPWSMEQGAASSSIVFECRVDSTLKSRHWLSIAM